MLYRLTGELIDEGLPGESPAAQVTRLILAGVNLRGADLSGADLSGVDLRVVYLRGGADLSGADLRGVDLSRLGLDIPVVADLDALVLAAVGEDGERLDMDDWHTSEATHCRAGHAIHIAGDAGYELERRVGASAAAALIYTASTGRTVPDFCASKAETLASIREDAAAAAHQEGS